MTPHSPEVTPLIFKEICTKAAISVEECKSRERIKSVVARRTLVCLLLLEKDYSFSAIGRSMNRDHSTVMHMASTEFRERRGLQATTDILQMHLNPPDLKKTLKPENYIADRFRKKTVRKYYDD